jgi:diacylglycerol kinase family enzyme
VSGLFLAIVGNTAPWTYFGTRPVVLTPNTSFDRGLDLVAMRKLRTAGTMWAAAGMLGGSGIRGRASLVLEDLQEFRLQASRPVHLQVDGDYLGERESATFRSVPAAIRVIG